MNVGQAVKSGNWLNLRRVRAYPRLVLFVGVLLGAAWMGGLHDRLMPNDGPNVTDFVNVYAAGQAVREGHVLDAYDFAKHKARQDALKAEVAGRPLAVPDDSVPWLYPPVFLFVAAAFSALPYWVSLFTYALGGFAAYVFSVWKLAPPFKESLWAVVAFPAAYINLYAGQNGALTAALVAGGLALLETMPMAAGICFGALIYKPQFFVLVPLALAAGRYWKAFFASGLSAAFFMAASVWAFGLDPWFAFFRNLDTVTFSIESGVGRWVQMLQSVFAMARGFGANATVAYVLQDAALAAVVVVLGLWRGNGSFAVKASALATALLLVSPYSLTYDQVLLAIPLVLIAGEGLRSGFLPYEKSCLFVVWFWPLIAQSMMGRIATLTPLVVAVLMVLIWRRGRAEKDSLKGS